MGLVVCFTGIGPLGRVELAKKAKSMGYEYSHNLTRRCDILVCSDTDAKSTKLKLAKMYRIKIVTYKEFFDENELTKTKIKKVKVVLEQKVKEHFF